MNLLIRQQTVFANIGQQSLAIVMQIVIIPKIELLLYTKAHIQINLPKSLSQRTILLKSRDLVCFRVTSQRFVVDFWVGTPSPSTLLLLLPPLIKCKFIPIVSSLIALFNLHITSIMIGPLVCWLMVNPHMMNDCRVHCSATGWPFPPSREEEFSIKGSCWWSHGFNCSYHWQSSVDRSVVVCLL